MLFAVCGVASAVPETVCHDGLRSSIVHVHKDHRLAGKKIYGFEAQSRIDCAQMCLQLEECVSANYFVERSYCESNSEDITSTADLVSASGYEFLGNLVC